jgi:hypothetical protein
MLLIMRYGELTYEAFSVSLTFLNWAVKTSISTPGDSARAAVRRGVNRGLDVGDGVAETGGVNVALAMVADIVGVDKALAIGDGVADTGGVDKALAMGEAGPDLEGVHTMLEPANNGSSASALPHLR